MECRNRRKQAQQQSLVRGLVLLTFARFRLSATPSSICQSPSPLLWNLQYESLTQRIFKDALESSLDDNLEILNATQWCWFSKLIPAYQLVELNFASSMTVLLRHVTETQQQTEHQRPLSPVHFPAATASFAASSDRQAGFCHRLGSQRQHLPKKLLKWCGGGWRLFCYATEVGPWNSTPRTSRSKYVITYSDQPAIQSSVSRYSGKGSTRPCMVRSEQSELVLLIISTLMQIISMLRSCRG